MGVLSHLMDQADAGRELEDIRNSFKGESSVDEALLPVYGDLAGAVLGRLGLLSQVIRMRWDRLVG